MRTWRSMNARADRVARNESDFRRINEQIERLEARPVAFEILCECADSDCMKLITIEKDVYESVRRYGRRFIVFPDHVDPTEETVFRRSSGYWIVEKLGEAAREAEAEDPRG